MAARGRRLARSKAAQQRRWHNPPLLGGAVILDFWGVTIQVKTSGRAASQIKGIAETGGRVYNPKSNSEKAPP